MMNLSDYKTLVFDCDGVVLDSNKVKTQAFYNAALPHGEQAAQQLVDYHVSNGGVSRYKKFEYFLSTVIDKAGEEEVFDTLINAYAQEVKKGLLACEIATGLTELRKRTPQARWLIVSGGDEKELRELFHARGLSNLFDGGVFGSPDTKDVILSREIESGNICKPAIFLGDSRYDHIASAAVGLDFVFISAWSEFPEWPVYCHEHGLKVIEKLQDLSN